jgi:hypothetical protein
LVLVGAPGNQRPYRDHFPHWCKAAHSYELKGIS